MDLKNWFQNLLWKGIPGKKRTFARGADFLRKFVFWGQKGLVVNPHAEYLKKRGSTPIMNMANAPRIFCSGLTCQTMGPLGSGCWPRRSRQSLEHARQMRYDELTDMGGVGEVFLTTHWSLLEEAGVANEEKQRVLIGLLLSWYWKPVYCFLRRKGYNNDQAKDLTQDFFHEIVLGRSLIRKADPSKGRFRSFLLTALKRYLINVARDQEAQKRMPKGKLVSLEDMDPANLPQVIPELTAEASFDYGWTSALLERVLDEVEAQCHADGRAVYWHVFHDRILQPIKERTDSPSVKETCNKYGIADGIKLSNMIVTVRRRIQLALKRHVCDSVMSDSELGEELETILRFSPGLAHDPE